MPKAKHPHNPDRPEPKAVKKALEKGDMKALGLSLSLRQRRFAEEYIIDFNGAAAAIRAGYSPKWSDRQASILMSHAGVSAYADHLTRQRSGSISALDPDYVIQGVMKTIMDAERAGDKLRGYELCAKILGMLTDKTEITGKDGGPIETEQRRVEQEAIEFTTMLKARAKKLKLVGGLDAA